VRHLEYHALTGSDRLGELRIELPIRGRRFINPELTVRTRARHAAYKRAAGRVVVSISHVQIDPLEVGHVLQPQHPSVDLEVPPEILLVHAALGAELELVSASGDRCLSGHLDLANLVLESEALELAAGIGQPPEFAERGVGAEAVALERVRDHQSFLRASMMFLP